MKHISRITLWLALGVLLAGCGQLALPAALTPVPAIQMTTSGTAIVELTKIGASQTATPTATSHVKLTEIADSLTVSPTKTVAATTMRSPTQTARPTIEAPQIPALLETSFLIQTADALNGHKMRKITGWAYGFQDYGMFKNGPSYQWLGQNHLLLHPVTGDVTAPEPISYSKTFPVVINLNSGKVWAPISDEVWNSEYYLPTWSAKLGILVTAQGDVVHTYNPDGVLITSYKGKLLGVSPSGTKLLLSGGIWIDLSNGRRVDFGWDKYSLRTRAYPSWSADENRVYICCIMYGDASTGESMGMSEYAITVDAKPVKGDLNTSGGEWAGNKYLLPRKRWDDTDPITTLGFIPLFDPAAKTYRNLIEYAGLPAKYNEIYVDISISPKGDYMTVDSPLFEQSYLVDLSTFRSQAYSGQFEWSANGKYGLIGGQDLTLFTIASKKLSALPPAPHLNQRVSPVADAWHPSNGVRASITADLQNNQTLLFMDVDTLSYKEVALPSEFHDKYWGASQIIWSPKGDRIALATVDGSLWQMDYPKLGKLEQLTPPMAKMKDIRWSPDGAYLSFVSDKDIYIVDIK